MRVVVVGATGNVGSALMERLAEDPTITEIRALARRPPGLGWPRTRFAAVDVASDELAPHLEGADAVVHLAWMFQPSHRPTETWRINVEGSLRVFDAVAEVGVPTLVYASSVGAYTPAAGQLVDESWPTHGLPTAAYSREKAYVERLLDAFEARRPDTRVVRLRTAFIFQASAASQQRRLFAGPLVPSPLLRLGRIPVLPFPTGLRFQALHATDAAAGYHLAVTGNTRGAFNLAAEPVIDATVLAEIVQGRRVSLSPRLVRAGLAAAWRAHLIPPEPSLFDLAMGLPLMSTDRARAELGWAPRLSATEAVAEMLGGLGHGAGAPTAPLAPDSLGSRAHEVATGAGQRP